MDELEYDYDVVSIVLDKFRGDMTKGEERGGPWTPN
jgi:hypothetical protein